MSTNAVIDGCKEAGLSPGDGVREVLADDEQEDLFDDLVAAQTEVDGQFKVFQKRRPVVRGGRKPGAKNRTTRDLVEFIRRTGVDPLMWFNSVARMDMKQINKEFGPFKSGQAAEFKRKCMVEFLRVMYPGSTIADLLKAAMGDDGALQVVGFMALAAAKPGDQGAAAPDIQGGQAEEIPDLRRPVETKENQRLSEGEDG